MDLKEFFIKRWYLFGIGWFLSLFLLIFSNIGTFVPIEISKTLFIILFFPGFIYSEVFKGLESGGAGIPIMFLFFLIPCYILAKILHLQSKGEGR